MIENFFNSIKVGITVAIIGFIVLIAILIATKGREWIRDKESKQERKAEIDSGIQIMSDIIPKLQSQGLYSYWKDIEKNISYLQKSQARPEPPYKFEATLTVFTDNGLDYITMTIESGYTMLNIIENELNKRGLKSPRQ